MLNEPGATTGSRLILAAAWRMDSRGHRGGRRLMRGEASALTPVGSGVVAADVEGMGQTADIF